MGKIIVTCPNCGKKYSISSEKMPQKGDVAIKCKECDFSFPLNPPLDQDEEVTPSLDSTMVGQRFVSQEGMLRDFPSDCEMSIRYMDKQGDVSKSLEKLITIFGRSEGDITINDPLISRKHASIEVKSSSLVELKDLASRNGTFHNGMKISSIHLQTGDIIKIGNIEITFSNKVKF